jgi:hypothetical protein
MNCCTLYRYIYYYFAATSFDVIAIIRYLLGNCCIAVRLNNIGISYLKIVIALKHVAGK